YLWFGGQSVGASTAAPEMVGGSRSLTVTVTWVDMAAPLSSEAVSTTSLFPTGYGPAGLSERETGSPSGSYEPLSTMAGVTVAKHCPGSVPMVMDWPFATGAWFQLTTMPPSNENESAACRSLVTVEISDPSNVL